LTALFIVTEAKSSIAWVFRVSFFDKKKGKKATRISTYCLKNYKQKILKF